MYPSLISAPIAQLANRTWPVRVGNVVGGGSVVNGMMFDRGSNADYDAWEDLGNVGWGWKGLAPYFKKAFTFTPPSETTIKEIGITYDESTYGDGPVQVSIPSYQYPDYKWMFGSWRNESVPMPKEGFANPIGAFWAPNTIDNSTAERCHAKKAYYDPAQSRPNLKLVTGTHVDEILFSTRNGTVTATGVRMTSRSDPTASEAFASREVILAAGAIFTPHLLMISGIGPADVLSSANITLKASNPGVGSNFQDHTTAYMNYNISNLAFPNYNTLATNASFNASAAAQYEKDRSGPWSGSRGNALAMLTLRNFSTKYQDLALETESQEPVDFLPERYAQNAALYAGFIRQRDILLNQYRGLPGYDAAVGEMPIQPNNRATAVHQKPLSRGTITLNTTHPHAYPIVQYNSLQNPVDKAILCELIRWNRKHWASPALSRYQPIENAPGAEYVEDDEIIAALLRKNAIDPSFSHPSGSCAMMPKVLGGCVSDQLLVYGVEKLSVVDASIIPMIPAAHLQATMYAVAEKAADIIKARS